MVTYARLNLRSRLVFCTFVINDAEKPQVKYVFDLIYYANWFITAMTGSCCLNGTEQKVKVQNITWFITTIMLFSYYIALWDQIPDKNEYVMFMLNFGTVSCLKLKTFKFKPA